MPGRADLQDGELARRRRIVEEGVKAPPAEGLRHLAGAVGGEKDERRVLRIGADRPDLGDGDLELGEDLEQERLELRDRRDPPRR